MTESIIECIGAFLYPPKCAACGKTLSRNELALCVDCRMKWELEKHLPCPKCAKPHNECECLLGEEKCLHLVPYMKSINSTARRVVLDAKSSNSRRLARFCAIELASMMRERGVSSDYALTFVPRSARSKRIYGVDQAESVARMLAKELGCELYTPFEHKSGTEQKRLRAHERAENAAIAYSLKKDAHRNLAGKRLILYDDVATTGATLLTCSALLKKAGCTEVLLLTLARTCNTSDY